MKKMRRLTALLLALSLVLGCSINAFAALPEEEETDEPQRLTPVYMDGPPMGTAGEYNDAGNPQTGWTTIDFIAQEITAGALTNLIIQDLGLTTGNPRIDAIVIPTVITLMAVVEAWQRQTDDDSANDLFLRYTEIRYGSRYPGCYKIVRVYDDAPEEEIIYYVMYV